MRESLPRGLSKMADVFREVEVTGDSSRGDSGQSGSDKCDMGDDSDEKDGGNILSSEEQCEKDEFYDADDLLSPVAKLEKYADNEITFNRQVVTKNILDTLRTVVGNNEEVTIVLNILQRLSEDQEPTVRTEVMEQVPHIAVFCSEFSSQFGYVIPKVLVPMVIRYFSDENDQVRKTSQAALLVLFEQGLMDRGNNFCMKAVVEEQVCPVILRLTEPDSFDDNYRTEAVALMSKLAPFIGMDLTLRFFLDKFSALCSDSLFHVRKVCAANFGDMCSVVGTETTESVLLPKFYYLCEDSVWDVRKACSEVFMAVSCACSLDTRKNDLAPLFINLLCDPSRWVKMSAFQTLGPFISTFADPHTTGLYYDGVSSICNPNKNTYNFEKTEEAAVACSNKDSDGSAEDANVTNNSQDNDDGSQPNCSTTKSVDEEEKTDIDDDSSSSLSREVVVDGDSNSSDDGHRSNADCGRLSIDDGSLSISDAIVSMDITSDVEGPTRIVYDAGGGDVSIEEKLADRRSLLCDNDSVTGVEEDLTSQKYSNSANKSSDDCDTEFHNISANVDDRTDVSADPDCYESFRYWRIPLPQIEIDSDVAPINKSDDGRRAYESSKQHQFGDFQCGAVICIKSWESGDPFSLNDLGDLDDEKDDDILGLPQNVLLDSYRRLSKMKNCDSDSAIGMSPSVLSSPSTTGRSPEDDSLLAQQDVVPRDLLEYFLHMPDSSYAQTIDTDITRHCAYSIPAVALTLGRNHWPCLKNTYVALSCDMQWKVRHTLASSIHEVAVVLGQDLATKDLIPIFNGFIKDLDEVRIGILRHLSDFLKFLRQEERRDYLPKLAEFIKTDNERNWRFRHELAQQMLYMAELYSPSEVKEYIIPISLCLVSDKVAEVRRIAYRVMAVMIKHLSLCEELLKPVLCDLANQFSHSRRWVRRQTYAILCRNFLEYESLTPEMYSFEVMPHLLDLSWDPVPNVRIAVAQCVSETILTSDFLSSKSCRYNDLMMQAVRALQDDLDRDVRFFINQRNYRRSYDHLSD